MKRTWSSLLTSLYVCLATASSGRVFVYDPTPVATDAGYASPTVSPETARLILAQRLGLGKYHFVENTDPADIKHINAFAGRRQPMFRSSDASNEAQVLVWLEGVDDPSAFDRGHDSFSHSFDIYNAPSSADNDRLIRDFIIQAQALPVKPDPEALTYKSTVEAEATFLPVMEAETYNEYLTVVRADASQGDSFSKIATALDQITKGAIAAGTTGPSITVVAMSGTTGKTKRSSKPYGAYDMPSLEVRRQKFEAVLSSSTPQASNLIGTSDDAITLQADKENDPKNDTSPVYGILPPRFDSKAKCEEVTHSCSGRGSCVGRGTTYACVCKPTKELASEHGMEESWKTTYWGGPACQKKDISMPFWLFVGTGIILAGLISAGIGLLYSMGSEELPSVIGAGVSGPTRK